MIPSEYDVVSMEQAEQPVVETGSMIPSQYEEMTLSADNQQDSEHNCNRHPDNRKHYSNSYDIGLMFFIVGVIFIFRSVDEIKDGE